MALFLLLIPSTSVPGIKFVDETVYMALLFLAIADSLCNNNWRNYRLCWLVVGIMAFYVVYSMIFVHYNTKGAVLYDAVIECKQYMALAVVLGARPRLMAEQKQIMRYIAVVNVACAFVTVFGGYQLIKIVFGHVAFLGSTVFLSAMIFLLTSIDEKGGVSKRNLMYVTIMLLCGLVCTRSKYYGECVLALFFLYLYRPGMLSRLNLKHALVVVAVLVLFVAVGWQKFDFYFISGNGDATRFDPEAVESYARPVLYFTGGLILIDHFPFGSGLASFASYPSTKPYSGLYHEYGIDKVYGLSEAQPEFVCDAYYPLLAQFGVVGFMLFIAFFVYACGVLRKLVRTDAAKYKWHYVIGSIMVCYALIESIAVQCLLSRMAFWP